MIKDQPPPIVQPDRVPVWDLVIADIRRKAQPGHVGLMIDMRDRDWIGRERYGTPLTTGNGRDHLVDAYQEALDLAVYLRTYLEEFGLGGSKSNDVIAHVYSAHLDSLLALARVIHARD